jgi:hypothetical protein
VGRKGASTTLDRIPQYIQNWFSTEEVLHIFPDGLEEKGDDSFAQVLTLEILTSEIIPILGKVGKCGSIPASIISCNYEDVLTGRVHVFDFMNICSEVYLPIISFDHNQLPTQLHEWHVLITIRFIV